MPQSLLGATELWLDESWVLTGMENLCAHGIHLGKSSLSGPFHQKLLKIKTKFCMWKPPEPNICPPNWEIWVPLLRNGPRVPLWNGEHKS